MFRYRSALRPIDQLPLNTLAFLIDPAKVGHPDNRELLMQHELSAEMIKRFDLTLIA